MTIPNRPARPWDIFNKNIEKVGEEIANSRLDICRSCDHFIKITQQCTQCGCIMPAKAKLPHASCPIEKWQSVEVGFKEEI
jgi:hypothetical protein